MQRGGGVKSREGWGGGGGGKGEDSRYINPADQD
jgi:hypothetical protein